jgi:hypothetical protein
MSAVAQPVPPVQPGSTNATTQLQTQPLTNELEELASPVTTYLESQIPFLPWLPADAPVMPEWISQAHPASPFLSPGLGTPSIGGSALRNRPLPGRGEGAAPVPLGPLDLRGQISYQALYGSGLLSGPGREEETWVHSITPEIIIHAGDHWTVGYTPSIRIYTAEDYDNTVNHTVSLGGHADYQNWRFRLHHATALTDDPLVETARQTEQTIHSTSLGARWDRGPRGTYDFSVSQSLRFRDEEQTGTGTFGSASDAFSWYSQNWYDYPFRPALRAGVGVGFGYDSIDPGTDMLNERLNVRLQGLLGDKLSYRLSAGAEFRQFQGSDADTQVSPVVSVNLFYQLLQKTSLSAGFSHDVGTSYFADQFTENTSVQGAIHQRLTERWSASASGGYRFTSYQSASAGTEVQREDGSAFASVSISGLVLPRTTLGVFYSFSSNDSDVGGFTYDSHQVGLNLTWTL